MTPFPMLFDVAQRRRAVVDIVANQGFVNANQVAKKLRIDWAIAQNHLYELAKTGLVFDRTNSKGITEFMLTVRGMQWNECMRLAEAGWEQRLTERPTRVA